MYVPMRTCPDCDGHGSFQFLMSEDTGGMGGIFPIYGTDECETCDGVGEIPHDEFCDCDICYREEE